ncbi:Tat pathway signal sequence domain protein [Streptomyces sp. Act143]|uniref:Tat pathway signal sequence domain protein n=1 Tax=Streptomyces sp. Act143 TaxID=2200760 RepID=UPI000D6732C3|nr:Tat pathway signal sequence domain protein [Streptomyces sp. Act143]PWI15149.1 Tat pathway signal sequence domain protein [Streptomyces sp. Act143]
MRRTGISALALACAAVVAGAVPAFADGGTATPSPVPTDARPSTEPTPVPSEARPSAEPSAAPSDDRTLAPSDQVSVVPRGAADTGVAESSSGSGGTLIGGGAAAAVAVGGGAFVLVRRRRANGA